MRKYPWQYSEIYLVGDLAVSLADKDQRKGLLSVYLTFSPCLFHHREMSSILRLLVIQVLLAISVSIYRRNHQIAGIEAAERKPKHTTHMR